MKRVLAVAVMTVLAFLGFAGTASAADDIDEEQLAKCEAEFDEAFLDLTAHLDDVEFEQLLYSIDDLFTRFDMGDLTEEELEAGLEELLPGLVDLFVEFGECLGSEEPKKPDMDGPTTVPTSVPAGHTEPDTGAGVTAALVALGLAAAGGGILLARRLVNNS
ncbi:MAG TPA: hypothetical protein VFR23_19055 [Jiangellaceae bacterium]|nr:hypothetical protein [Jiangellaceae bacterium]